MRDCMPRLRRELPQHGGQCGKLILYLQAAGKAAEGRFSPRKKAVAYELREVFFKPCGAIISHMLQPELLKLAPRGFSCLDDFQTPCSPAPRQRFRKLPNAIVFICKARPIYPCNNHVFN
jgi:hypothetical protein